MTEALLRVCHLSIGIHREFPAGIFSTGPSRLLSSVEDIGFEIYPGEILGLVGESGSGKSLTALSIAGLLGEDKEVTGGSILLSGPPGERDLLRLPEKELAAVRGKEISMVFQEPFSSLNPLMKVGAQIEETLLIHGERDRKKIAGQTMELLARLKFDEPQKIAGAYPHRLSGGMCQRIMIALAVICRPRLLIADEPTTALDRNSQDQIIALLKEINRDLGTSVLFISHDLELVKNLCGRVLVIYSGRILEEGGAEEIFYHPAHEYTRGLLSSIPGGANRGKDLISIPGKIPSLEEGRPEGCPFHPRCGRAVELCRGVFPPAVKAGANHYTHCVLPVPLADKSPEEGR